MHTKDAVAFDCSRKTTPTPFLNVLLTMVGYVDISSLSNDDEEEEDASAVSVNTISTYQ
jgi:hypothetical protein